jgi:hypothetical protein
VTAAPHARSAPYKVVQVKLGPAYLARRERRQLARWCPITNAVSIGIVPWW